MLCGKCGIVAQCPSVCVHSATKTQQQSSWTIFNIAAACVHWLKVVSLIYFCEAYHYKYLSWSFYTLK